MPTLFTVPGHGTVEPLDRGHLQGWNKIAADPASRLEVYIPDLTVRQLQDINASRDPDWHRGVQGCSAERLELVALDGNRDVTAILHLRFYPCDDDEQNFGVLVEVAVAVHRTGLGTALMRELARWIDHEVPGAHVFADVCTQNNPSEKMLIAAGWRYVSPGRNSQDLWIGQPADHAAAS